MAAKNKQTHRAYAFVREARRTGWPYWSGTGWVETTRPLAEIAETFDIGVDVVEQILGLVSAHMFVRMIPHHGGSGYYFLLPKAKHPQRPMEEPEDPGHDRDDEED
jgi:hypothetical protein